MTDRTRTAVAVGLLGICLAGIAWQQPSLFNARARQNPRSATPIENAPPLVAFTTVALGGFSGLLVDILWARVTVLQDSGQYLEIVQLSNWITQLEPRLAVVWDYHSFNLAYNITAMCPDPAERWQWVKSGISLLRDKAIVYNPDYLVLYDRLCRIYKNKLIDGNDPAQQYYRLAFAGEMNAVTDNGAVPTSASKIDRLKTEYRLDAATMKELDRLFGPLDWRLPQAHVIYWAFLGRGNARAGLDIGFDYMICDTLANAVLNGHVKTYQPEPGVLETGPDWTLLPRAQDAYRTAMATHEFKADGDSPIATTYKQFLRQILVLSYEQEQTALSASVFDTLKTEVRDPETSRSLPDYVSWTKSIPVDNPASYQQQIYSHDCSKHAQGDHNL